MKIPEYIRIGGVDYAVIETPGLNNGTQVCYGHIDFEKSLIEFNPERGTSHQFKGQILWHEILHGIAHHANLEFKDDEEQIIDTLAKGIYQVLQDNGKRLFDIR
jgi:hypothetical protein